MFVIMVYDVGKKRVAKVLKKSRKYLHWVQNSVFEGEISPAKLKKLRTELERMILLANNKIYIKRGNWA